MDEEETQIDEPMDEYTKVIIASVVIGAVVIAAVCYLCPILVFGVAL